MDGQMTIFDFIKPKEIPLDELSDDEMAKRISEATGLNFKLRSDIDYFDYPYYEAKMGLARYHVMYDNYTMSDCQGKFIAVGYDLKTSGGGSPCDSLTDAINRIKGYMEVCHGSGVK